MNIKDKKLYMTIVNSFFPSDQLATHVMFKADIIYAFISVDNSDDKCIRFDTLGRFYGSVHETKTIDEIKEIVRQAETFIQELEARITLSQKGII